jgi:hypothetical protein
MRKSCSPAVALLALALVATTPADPVAERTGPDVSSAVVFVESVCRGIGFEETECTGPSATLGRPVRCGTIRHGAVHQAAQAVALELADRGVDVLDVQVPLNAPPTQWADLPGFGPVPDMPGYSKLVYLIGDQRVLIWIDVPPLSERVSVPPPARPRQVAFKIEPLDGPFPHTLPASPVSPEQAADR